jgi:hypothetical protein
LVTSGGPAKIKLSQTKLEKRKLRKAASRLFFRPVKVERGVGFKDRYTGEATLATLDGLTLL